MLEKLVAITNILGSLSLVVSVIILAREIRQNNRLTRAANTQAMVEISGPFYLTMVQDRALAELFFRSAKNFDALDEIDRRRYKQLLVWWMIFYENIFYQRKQGLLDRHTFRPWWRDFKSFLRDQNVAQHWEKLKDLYQEEFAKQVSAIIAESSHPKSSGDDQPQ